MSETDTLDIDKHGRVQRNGRSVCIYTPRARAPFGVETYGTNHVVNFEFTDDEHSDRATRKFVKALTRIEQELERRLDGSFLSSMRASGERTGVRMRTRLMTDRSRVVLTEIVRDGQEVAAHELTASDAGVFHLRLQSAWTMQHSDEHITAGAVWVVVSGELESL